MEDIKKCTNCCSYEKSACLDYHSGISHPMKDYVCEWWKAIPESTGEFLE